MIPGVRRVLVLGDGSAGFLAAIAVKNGVPDVDVEVVRSPEVGVFGDGESTTPLVPRFLHGTLNLDLHEFYRKVKPSWKLGVRYEWGPRPTFYSTFADNATTQYTALRHPTGYYCREDFDDATIDAALLGAGKAFLRGAGDVPLIARTAAYHLDNAAFASYLEENARNLGIKISKDAVHDIEANDRGVAHLKLASGRIATADLYVDCTGFRSLLLGEAMREPFESYKSSLFCDRAIVGSWDRDDEPILPFTVAETMDRLIDCSNDTEEHKRLLKDLWRALL